MLLTGCGSEKRGRDRLNDVLHKLIALDGAGVRFGGFVVLLRWRAREGFQRA